MISSKSREHTHEASIDNMANEDSLLSVVVIGNPERHVRKASHRGSKQQ